MDTYKVIGLMSGTSLDGLDIAYCQFAKGEVWSGSIEKAITIDYSDSWKKNLSGLFNGNAEDLAKIHVEYGHYLGKQVSDFVKINKLHPDIIASHGHTIFHQPQNGFTLQIGDGNAIFAETGIPVIFDFRSLDVALGGQGAPLVPIGDRMLFGKFDFCLNLGGFANISFEQSGKRLAFDVCPVNMILNYLAEKLGKSFDENGEIASTGKLDKDLFNQLNSLEYYQKSGVKSLGREWFESEFLPLVMESSINVEDKLNTVSEHIALQISRVTGDDRSSTIIVTGGGAYNEYLISRIKSFSKVRVDIPQPGLIDYKEALIFGFLGVLRWRNEINCLSSVTGARHDCSSGVIITDF